MKRLVKNIKGAPGSDRERAEGELIPALSITKRIVQMLSNVKALNTYSQKIYADALVLRYEIEEEGLSH